MSTKKSTKSPKVESEKPRTQIPAETLPRRTLPQVIQVAHVLHNTYAGKSASWDDLAKALEIGPTSANTKYIFWSAEAYGIVNREDKLISLSETGRKIVAPTYDQEDTEGKIKAVLTPTVLSKFYSDYNGHPIPLPVHFPNVLESNFGIPRDRVEEAISIIVENAIFAGILEEQSGGQPLIKISGVRPTNIALEPDKIPFDVSQGRTITVDTSDVYTVMDRFESARRELSEHVKHIQSPGGQDGAEDNPINVYLPGLKVTITALTVNALGG